MSSSYDERSQYIDRHFDLFYEKHFGIKPPGNPSNTSSTPIEMPRVLFKYRGSNELDIDSFVKGAMYFRHPCFWPDKNDSSIRFLNGEDLAKRKPQTNKNVYLRVAKALVRTYLKETGSHGLTNKQIDKLIDAVTQFDESGMDGSVDYGAMEEELIRLGAEDESAQTASKRIKESTEATLDSVQPELNKVFSAFSKFQKTVKEDNYACSLCEIRNSETMWQKYIPNNDGFMVGYRTKFFGKASRYYPDAISPILYGKQKIIDILEVFVSLIAKHDLRISEWVINQELYGLYKDLYRSVLYKNDNKEKGYLFEKEWRIILSPKEAKALNVVDDVEHKGGVIPFPYATEIVIGRGMAKEKQQRLINKAKELSIPYSFWPE